MTAALAVAGAAALIAVLYALVQKASPGFALVLSAAGAVVILLRLGAAFQGAWQGVAQLGQKTDGEAFGCLLRCAGILLVCDYARALCEEAGVESLAWCTSLAGRCLMLAAAWPLLGEVCGRLWELTG